MSGYQILYYSEQVQDDILALPPKLLARYVALTKRMQAYGANLGMPHSKALNNGLFELRLKADAGIARIFYCTRINKEIVMLHCLIKKTQKIPMNALNIANQRLKEIKNANP